MLLDLLALLEDPSDEPLFVETYERYNARAYWTAFGVLHNQQDAEDAAIKAWERVAKNFATAKECLSKSRAVLEGWLVVIVKNAAKDKIKKNKKYADLVDKVAREPGPVGPDPEASAEVRRAMELTDAMPDNVRKVMNMRRIGYSFKEIGKSLGCRENTARMRYDRALASLRQQMMAEGYECPEI